MAVQLHNVTAAGGRKYVFHPQQIESLLSGDGHSVISATIAPTNSCNLHCSYCNQKNRLQDISLPLTTIKEFIDTLLSRGLEGVVISGGGEPTRYKQFNELVRWLKNDKDLALGLITNGTNNRCGNEIVDTWDEFDWIRISLNFVKNKLLNIKVPNKKDGKIGFSFIYTDQSKEILEQVAKLAEVYRAKFVRVMPDVNKSNMETNQAIEKLREIIRHFDNKDMFAIQRKPQTPAKTSECHVAKIKTFLCADGSLAPCDCFPSLTDASGNKIGGILPEKFNLNKSGIKDYLDFLDGKRTLDFNPKEDCDTCSYAANNSLLDQLFTLRAKYPQASVTELFDMMGMKATDDIIDVKFV